MSYNGTVRCGYCGGEGHNRRSCEDLREYAENNPDSWTARQYKRRKEAASARSQNRRCSFCGKSGHNRRSCQSLKIYRDDLIEKEVAWRRQVIGGIKERGLGIGALVRYNGQHRNFRVGDNKERTISDPVYMVVGLVEFSTMGDHAFNHWQAAVGRSQAPLKIQATYLPMSDRHGVQHEYLPRDLSHRGESPLKVQGEDYGEHWYTPGTGFELVGPSHSMDIDSVRPEFFTKEVEMVVNHYLKEKQSDDYYENRYQS